MNASKFDMAFAFSIFSSNFLSESLLYSFVTSGSFLFVWVLGQKAFARRRLQNVRVKKSQIVSEIQWSIVTFAIWSFGAIGHSWLYWNGFTKLYSDPQKYGKWYLPLSFFLFLVLHDAYFYWTHRAFHHPVLFKRFHSVHHRSFSPTPFAGFSVHPVEAVVHYFYFILVSVCVPLHETVFLLGSMTLFFGVTNLHLGYDFAPRWLGRWFSLASHHDIHHMRSRYWYGAAFTFWDRVMKTGGPAVEQNDALSNTSGRKGKHS